MALKLNCLENLTAIGIGLGACALAPFDAGLTAGAVIGGAGLFARIRENMRKAGLDDRDTIARMQKTILRGWDHWQATQEFRDAVTEADAAMTRLLPQVMMTREELAATATKSVDGAYPKAAALEVVDRLALHEAMFARPVEGVEPSLARIFALEVIERALQAAKEDKDYATLLTLDIAIELGRAIAETIQAVKELGAKIDAGFAAVQKSLGGEFERVSVQALRGAVARFVVFKPDATTSEVVDAVEEFVPQYEELRTRIAALEADDNRLRGAQQAAEHALDLGDLDAARRHLAEAADIQVERLAEPVRQTAATIDELARADLLALDWQSADANWSRASAMLMPFDLGAAEAVEAIAATALAAHGERFAQAPALLAATSRLRALAGSAASRGDNALWVRLQDNLGNSLSMQGERVGGEAGLTLLSQAVEAYRAALTVYTKDATPVDWAMTQNNLGNSLLAQGQHTGGEAGSELLKQAVGAYRSALAILTKAGAPAEWAMAQSNLGSVLLALGQRIDAEDGLALVAEAVESYRAALTVHTEEVEPARWAMTQGNLANALGTQGSRSPGKVGLELLAQSAEAYRATLVICTEAAVPADWALTQHNLGSTLSAQGQRTNGEAGLALLAEAVEAFRTALTVRTRSGTPAYWAMTQSCLGGALRALGERIEGEAGRVLLQDALEAYRSALTVRTEAAMPGKWAITKENMAICHESMAERISTPLDALLAAKEAILEALRVYTPEHMGYYHRHASASLSRVRAKIAMLEKWAAPSVPDHE